MQIIDGWGLDDWARSCISLCHLVPYNVSSPTLWLAESGEHGGQLTNGNRGMELCGACALWELRCQSLGRLTKLWSLGFASFLLLHPPLLIPTLSRPSSYRYSFLKFLGEKVHHVLSTPHTRTARQVVSLLLHPVCAQREGSMKSVSAGVFRLTHQPF